jgi:hypothetical protein
VLQKKERSMKFLKLILSKLGLIELKVNETEAQVAADTTKVEADANKAATIAEDVVGSKTDPAQGTPAATAE